MMWRSEELFLSRARSTFQNLPFAETTSPEEIVASDLFLDPDMAAELWCKRSRKSVNEKR